MRASLKVTPKWREYEKLLGDPGIPFSAGNCFLFAQTGTGPFLFVFFVFILGLLGKISLLRSSPKWIKIRPFRTLQKPYFAFEATGCACLLLVPMAIIHNATYGVVCGLCFGYANLIQAHRFEQQSQAPIFRLNRPIRLSYLFLELAQEPIVLIALGMVCSGLSGGKSSLLALPLMLYAPILLLTHSEIHRAKPQILFAIGSLWYTLVAALNGNFQALMANGFFSLGFLTIAWNENNLNERRREKHGC